MYMIITQCRTANKLEKYKYYVNIGGVVSLFYMKTQSKNVHTYKQKVHS